MLRFLLLDSILWCCGRTAFRLLGCSVFHFRVGTSVGGAPILSSGVTFVSVLISNLASWVLGEAGVVVLGKSGVAVLGKSGVAVLGKS